MTDRPRFYQRRPLHDRAVALRDLAQSLAVQYQELSEKADSEPYERGLNAGVALSYRRVHEWLADALRSQADWDAQLAAWDAEEEEEEIA